MGQRRKTEIGAKVEKDSAVNREQSTERARVKERREVRAHMNFRLEMSGIGGDNNHNGKEENGKDLIHSSHKARNHICADVAL